MRRITAERVAAGTAVLIAALRLLDPSPLALLDLRVLDMRHTLRGPVAAGNEVVIVGIDAASLTEVGRWPWPRARLATLVDRLSEADAAVIGLDIIFEEPDTTLDLGALRRAVAARPGAPARELLAALGSVGDDTGLAAAFRRSGRVVAGYFAEFGETAATTSTDDPARVSELPVRALGGVTTASVPFVNSSTRVHASLPVLTTAAAGTGHLNFLPHPDGVYRRVPLVIRAGERLLPSLGLEMVRRYQQGATTVTISPHGVTDMRVADRRIPIDGAGQLWINHLGPPRTLRHLSAADVLEGRAPREALAGRIVLVGFTAAGFDKVATPFAPAAPGVALHANVIDNLLHGASLRRPWWVAPMEAIVCVLVGIAIGMALRRRGATGGALTAAALALGYAWATQRLFSDGAIALGAIYPVGALVFSTLAGAVFQSMVEEREKRQVRDAFRHYLNPEVTDLIASHPDRLRLGGERREVTVLFSDIRGFTGLSEGLDPLALGGVLNEYLGAMTDVVFRHGGLLDKYIGDAVMAFWGAPVEAPDHAARCCGAALDMLAALEELHEGWRPRGIPLFEVRIGINTGEVVVGNFGSAHRFSYTAIGSEVNLASRLEGLNKELGTSILVSDTTCRALGDAFVCRELDRVRVKGAAQPVVVHELLGRREADRDGRLRARAEGFAPALAAYRRREWDEAITRLVDLVRRHPEDRAARAFLERCHLLRETPPGHGWDAVFEQTIK